MSSLRWSLIAALIFFLLAVGAPSAADAQWTPIGSGAYAACSFWGKAGAVVCQCSPNQATCCPRGPGNLGNAGAAPDPNETLVYCELPPATGSLSYYLLAVTYLPPGNQSTAAYLHGTTLGSQTQIQVVSAAGIAAQITAPGLQVSSSYLYGGVSGTAYQVTSNGSWGPQVTSSTDLMDHLHDKFWLWINAQMSLNQEVLPQGPGYDANIWPPSGQPFQVVDVTVAELAGLEAMPSYKAAMLANLSASDKAAILSTDPFVSGPTGTIRSHPSLDRGRFTDLGQHFEITGPDAPDDAASGFALDTNTQEIHGAISGSQQQTQFSLQGGGDVGFLGVAAFVGSQIQYTYQSTVQQNSGSITDAQGLLESNTPCWHQGVELYWDRLFGTYLFYPTDGGNGSCNNIGPSILGKLRSINFGQAPGRGTEVTGRLPNGRVFKARVDSRGAFRFYDVPPDSRNQLRIDAPAGFVAEIEPVAAPAGANGPSSAANNCPPGAALRGGRGCNVMHPGSQAGQGNRYVNTPAAPVECPHGLVRRDASSGRDVCVTPQARQPQTSNPPPSPIH